MRHGTYICINFLDIHFEWMMTCIYLESLEQIDSGFACESFWCEIVALRIKGLAFVAQPVGTEVHSLIGNFLTSCFYFPVFLRFVSKRR